jgi:ABC-2 type transport system permease protein
MALALGSVLGFLLVWDGIAAGVSAAVTGLLPGLHPEPWYFLLERLSPMCNRRSTKCITTFRISTVFSD